MTPERLQELIAGFSSRRIAVIGDFFLDKYLDTDPRILERSVESGQPAHQVVAIRCTPGGSRHNRQQTWCRSEPRGSIRSERSARTAKLTTS